MSKPRITDYAQWPRRSIRPTKDYLAAVASVRERTGSDARSTVLILHYFALHKIAGGR